MSNHRITSATRYHCFEISHLQQYTVQFILVLYDSFIFAYHDSYISEKVGGKHIILSQLVYVTAKKTNEGKERFSHDVCSADFKIKARMYAYLLEYVCP